ncbi:MAG: 3-phytase [Crocinitomicaceae bacterium]|jgi:3-phytase|nr:3-phytase [Crocinitomicaceae bacterium]
MRFFYLISFLICFETLSGKDIFLVKPLVETESVYSTGDAADDPAVWVNSKNPYESLVFGTDKQAGIHVYDLNGQELSFSKIGKMNNIDLRVFNGSLYVISSNRSLNTMDLWSFNNENLFQFFSGPSPFSKKSKLSAIKIEFDVYGICMGIIENNLIAIVTEHDGSRVQSWDLLNQRLLKEVNIIEDENNPAEEGNESEGCVVDDQNEIVFISREGSDGILKAFNAEDLSLIKKIDDREGFIDDDPEGIAIYETSATEGYLLLSSQGDGTVNVYDRNYPFEYQGSFRVAFNKGIDGASDTDGIEVTSKKIGKDYPRGLLIVQDGYNDEDIKQGNQNFKYVSFQDVINNLKLKK